jgi:hypothetical protein
VFDEADHAADMAYKRPGFSEWDLQPMFQQLRCLESEADLIADLEHALAAIDNSSMPNYQ